MLGSMFVRKLAMALLVSTALIANAYALDRPGVPIPFDFWQDYVPLPDSYAASDPGIYAGAQKSAGSLEADRRLASRLRAGNRGFAR